MTELFLFPVPVVRPERIGRHASNCLQFSGSATFRLADLPPFFAAFFWIFFFLAMLPPASLVELNGA